VIELLDGLVLADSGAAGARGASASDNGSEAPLWP
jgi:hypothetical protein